jgi:hypothetical protein
MKRVKRSILAGLLLIVVATPLYGWWRFNHAPAYYHGFNLTPPQREEAARTATNKLANVQNAAALAAAIDVRRRNQPPTTGSANPALPDPISVSFTAEELNAFYEKWAVFEGWKAAYQRDIEQPAIILQPGRMILAAKVTSLGTVASIELQPHLDDQGRFAANVTRVRLGDLPLPQRLLSGYRERLAGAIIRRMPQWRFTAQIRDDGSANGSAICATMGQLLLDTLAHQPADPIIFLPVIDRGSIPVRLIDVHVGDDTLTLTVRPMTPAERQVLQKQMRTGTALTG